MGCSINQDHLSYVGDVGPAGINGLEAFVNTENLIEEATHQAAVTETEQSKELEDEVLVLVPEVMQILIKFLNLF